MVFCWFESSVVYCEGECPEPIILGPGGGATKQSRLQERNRSEWALASIRRGAVADGARLPAQSVNLEFLVLRAGPTILNEPRRVSWLRLDLRRRLIFLTRLLFRNGFRSSLEVFFAELEFRHNPYPCSRKSVLVLEECGGPDGPHGRPGVRATGPSKKKERKYWCFALVCLPRGLD